MAAIPPFSQKSLKAQINSIGSPLTFSGLFLWWQSVNRCDCSRIYRTDVEFLLCKRKEHLFGKYPLSRDVKIQSVSPPLSNSLLQIKRCPLESQSWWCLGPWLPCAVSASERASGLGKLFSLGGLLQPELSSVVVWRDENVGLLGFKWRLSTNLNWFDGFNPFDWWS